MRANDAKTAVCNRLLAERKGNDGAAITYDKIFSTCLKLPGFALVQRCKAMRFELIGYRVYGVPGAGAVINKVQQGLRLLSGFY